MYKEWCSSGEVLTKKCVLQTHSSAELLHFCQPDLAILYVRTKPQPISGLNTEHKHSLWAGSQGQSLLKKKNKKIFCRLKEESASSAPRRGLKMQSMPETSFFSFQSSKTSAALWRGATRQRDRTVTVHKYGSKKVLSLGITYHWCYTKLVGSSTWLSQMVSNPSVVLHTLFIIFSGRS